MAIYTTDDTAFRHPPSAIRCFNSILTVVFFARIRLAVPSPSPSNAITHRRQLQTPSSISAVKRQYLLFPPAAAVASI